MSEDKTVVEIYVGKHRSLSRWLWKITFSDETYIQGTAWSSQSARNQIKTKLTRIKGESND